MRALIWGFGSIGQRHSKGFTEAGFDVAVLTRRQGLHDNEFNDLPAALKWKPDIVVICTETSKHFQQLDELIHLGFAGKILVEKPLAQESVELTPSMLNSYVAYNLRFYEGIQKLKQSLRDEKVISLFAYVGQYLPTWRPTSDYRNSYSAKKKLGGGVLRDLSHELDYLAYLAGPFLEMTASGGHLSNLEIETEDAVTILAKNQKSLLTTIHLNYLDRDKARFLTINTDQHTYRLNFVDGSLSCDGQQIHKGFDVNQSYREMYQSIKRNDWSIFATASEALHIVDVIECSGRAMQEKVWVKCRK